MRIMMMWRMSRMVIRKMLMIIYTIKTEYVFIQRTCGIGSIFASYIWGGRKFFFLFFFFFFWKMG